MSYHVKVQEGDAWLDLLDETGETELFETRAAAMIRAKALLQARQIKHAAIWGPDGEQGQLWMMRNGNIGAEFPLE